MSNDNPIRPENVPAEAIWYEDDNEWGLGLIEDGKYKGNWKWWRPDGSIVCETNFDNDGFAIDYTRYHPDGTISRQGTYKGEVEHGITTCYRSHNETDELFPPRPRDYLEIWKTVSTFEDGKVIDEKYYFEDGEEFYLYFDGFEEEEETDNETEQVTFDSVEEASKRWIKEGLEQSSALNKWIENGYERGWKDIDLEREPADTRGDMIKYVIDYVSEANKNKDFTSPRKLFPPAYDPTYCLLAKHAKQVDKIILLDDLRIIAQVTTDTSAPEVYEINNNDINKIDDLFLFGKCPNKKYFAKAYKDRIDVTLGWDGDIITTCKYPKYSDMIEDFDFKKVDNYEVFNILVFPDGKKIILVTDGGIFAVSENEAKLLYPYENILKNALKTCKKNNLFELKSDNEMAHAAISNDGKYVVLGCMDSQHVVLNGDLNMLGTIRQHSDHPCYAMFHPKCNYFALNSCYEYDGVTIAAPIDILDNLKTADEQITFLDKIVQVYSAVPFQNNIVLGDSNGYLFCKENFKKTNWYCFVGGILFDMDISKDEKYIAVSTYAGFVHLLKLDADKKDDYLITNTNIKEEKRWVFWNEYEPMVW